GKRLGEHVRRRHSQHVKGSRRQEGLGGRGPLGWERGRGRAGPTEANTRRFYERALEHTSDASIRKLLGDLAAAEREHLDLAQKLSQELLTGGAIEREDAARHRAFVLQVVQPGLAGLMDGSVSTLAPLFAAA